ncbi:MAG: hypothetical protein H7Y59_20650 [Anaerolineales bacterium]|nr:hypothetical protein [Anaerolineales bacterium]
MVEKAHSQALSWRKAARALNVLYGVSLSHTAWRDYAMGKHDIANPETRARLMLPARACPSCGHKHATPKPAKQKKIRVYGYPIEKVKTFFEALDLHHAPR